MSHSTLMKKISSCNFLHLFSISVWITSRLLNKLQVEEALHRLLKNNLSRQSLHFGDVSYIHL